MKLQINDAGSWRHILTFDKSVEADVRERVVKLVVVVNERAKLRILDDLSELRAHCQGPDFTWEERTK
jgi:hypothetical protein